MPTSQKIFVSLIGCITIGFGAALGFVAGVRLCEVVHQAWKARARSGNFLDSTSPSKELQLLSSEPKFGDLSGNEAAQDDATVKRRDINMKVQMEIRKKQHA
jgi:hypothetical protein